MTTTLYLGIDNGKSGALVTVNSAGKVQNIERTPSVKVGSGNKSTFDIVTAAQLIRDYSQCELCVALEKSSPMPRRLRGGNASFNTALVYGAWQGILTALGVSHIIVSAAEWQNRFLRGVDGDTKAASVMAARRARPDAPWPTGNKKDLEAACDAYWLAEYCRRYWKGGAKDFERS